MSEHTQEPWNAREWAGDEWPQARVSVGPQRDGHATAVAISPKYTSQKQAATDFRRIAACVNACAGIPTQELEDCCDNTDDWDRLEMLANVSVAHMLGD